MNCNMIVTNTSRPENKDDKSYKEGSYQRAPRYPQFPLPILAENYATAQQIAANPFRRAGFQAMEAAIVFKCDIDAKLARLRPFDRRTLELIGQGFTKQEIALLTGQSARTISRSLMRFYEPEHAPMHYSTADKLIAHQLRSDVSARRQLSRKMTSREALPLAANA